jgi:hypothetical protein
MSNQTITMNNVLEYLRTLEHAQYFEFGAYEHFERRVIVIRAECKLCHETMLMNYTVFESFDGIDAIKYITERVSVELNDMMEKHLLQKHIQQPNSTRILSTSSSPPSAGYGYDQYGNVVWIGFGGGSGSSAIAYSSGSAGSSGRAGTYGDSGVYPLDYSSNVKTSIPSSIPKSKKSQFIDAIEKILDLDE